MNAPSLRTVRALNAPNVVVLPTAAARQVRQNYNRAAAGERKRLREEGPWPAGRYVSPQMREARERAKAMQRIEISPLFMVVVTMLSAAPREQRAAMIEQLAPAAVHGGYARDAVEIIRTTLLNLGEQMDLLRAQQEFGGEEGA